MSGVLAQRIEEARETERRICRGTDRIVSRKFGIVAKALWPLKTAAHIAAIAKKDERTAARWLSGEIPAPAIVIAAIVVEITETGE